MTDRARRAYLAGPADGPPAERWAQVAPAVAQLSAFGLEVLAPAATRPDTPTSNDSRAVVEDDMDTLRLADCLVVLPGSEDAWEIPVATAFGIKVMPLNEALDILSA
ncbi:nucleoside 2-deoxyribosyltransferase [Actinoplanes philippinensis]|uniref:nucleoside 2-deoxyribosyltransferase n=1 Tax=Actinoplanes philippinensis TaxID=35752 RepID=UPI00340B8DF4